MLMGETGRTLETGYEGHVIKYDSFQPVLYNRHTK